MKTKALIKQFFTNHISLIFSLAIIMFLDLVFTIACPVISKFLIDEMQNVIYYGVKGTLFERSLYDSRIALIILSCVLAASIIGAIVFNMLKQRKINQIGNSLTVDLKNNIFSTVIRSDLNEIEGFDKEDLKNKIIKDTDKIGNTYYANHIIKLIYSFSLSFGGLVLAFVYNATIGLVCLLCGPILYVLVGSIVKAKAKKYEKLVNDINEQNEVLDYSITNIKNVKIRNGLEIEESKYEDLAKKIQKDYTSNLTLASLEKNDSFIVLFTAAFFIVLGLVAYQFYVDNTYKISEAVAYVFSIALFFYNLRNCLVIFYDKQNIDATYESLNKVLELKLENRSESINTIDEIYSLRFSNVSYTNDKKKVQELINVDFELKKGERLGILGMASSGKTIITDLTTKVIRPTSGSITINNCDLLKINTYYLRNIITYIPQNFTLLDTTIEGNIIYPLSLDEYKYNEALNKCFIKDLLMDLPDRDKENVNKAKLSEANKQKIALANAIYKDSPIIVLDDATTKLDAQTENKIIDEFLKLKNKIEIIASSQINIVAKCDKVLLLSNGKVLEYGKTEDLLNNKNSVFYRMYNNVAVR